MKETPAKIAGVITIIDLHEVYLTKTYSTMIFLLIDLLPC